MSKKNNIAVSDYFLTNNLNDDEDFIPIISEEDNSGEELVVPETLPILPLRNTVLFPGIVVPITVGRDKSIKLIREAFKKDKIIGTVAQRNPNINEPAEKDLFKVGTVAQILKILDMPDNSTSVIIQGRKRFEIGSITNDEPYIQAHINVLPEDQPSKKNKEFEAIISSLKDISLRIIQLNNNVPAEASFAIRNIESPSFLINFASSNSDIKTEEKQKLLEMNDVHKRGLLLLEYLTRELQLLELKRDIQSKVKTDLDQQQREYLLHQQMKTIQDELGGNPVDQEVQELEKKAKKEEMGQRNC